MKRLFAFFLFVMLLVPAVLISQTLPFDDDQDERGFSTESGSVIVAPERVETVAPDRTLLPAAPADLDVLAADASKPAAGFLIIGHMGAPMEEPDNTIEGFQKALDLGANAIETDICMTRDGHLVHWHDWDPDEAIANFRQLGKQGLKYRPFCPGLFGKYRKPCPRLTLLELRQKYGYTLRKNRLGTAKKAPHQIPTFEEFCRWAAGQKSLKKVFLDVKIPKKNVALVPEYFKKVITLLDTYQLKEKAICMIPVEEVLTAALPIAKEGNLAVCFDRELPPVLILHPSKFSAVKKAVELGLSYASVGRPVATFLGYKLYLKIIKSDLKTMKERNSAAAASPFQGLIAWTIDDPYEMAEILKLGVHGIVTNKPDVLKKIVDRPEK